MSNIPSQLRYAKSHEWLQVEGKKAKVGISDFAQHSLGDIVFVDLPNIGQTFKVGDEFGAVESVKAASSLFMPVSGKVIAVNHQLIDAPQSLNEDAYEHWIIEIEITKSEEIEQLLDANQYETLTH
jgi:glycine cleavage system H protein